MWRMLARLGKYEQKWALSVFPSHSYWTHIESSHLTTCVFWGGWWLQDWRHILADWQRLSMRSLVKVTRTNPKSTWIRTLVVLRQWAAIPTWTHTHTTHMLERGLLDTHVTEDDSETWLCSIKTLKCDGRNIHVLNTLNYCVGRSFVTIFLCFSTMQYWIQPLCCWKMYLPVHFVYMKPRMAVVFWVVVFCFFLYKYYCI